jgi:hypothetical protein
MRIAMADLKLDYLYVVYPGTKAYKLARKVEAMPLSQLATNGGAGLSRGKN